MELGELLYELSEAKHPTDVASAWLRMGPAARRAKAVIALENYEKSFLPPAFVKTVYSDDNDFIPYLQSGNLFFVDHEILEGMLSPPGNAQIPIDYSIMFDTNYASYIHQFVNGETNHMRNEVFASISILLREEFQFDYHFYLLENSKSVDLMNEFDIDEFIMHHQDLYRNIISLELFKSIDSELFKSEGKIKYTISQGKAIQDAEHLIYMIYCSEKGKDFLSEFTFLHKQMTLFLIGMFRINFSSNKSAQNKMRELFEFMHEKIGVYLERETIVAHKYFKQQGKLRIFRKIQRNGDTSKLTETIQNIAWDFIAPRAMENFMNFGGGGGGKFFLPYLLSHDAGLKEIMSLFNIKGVYLDGSYGFIPIPAMNTQEYYESEACKIDFDAFFSSESKLSRLKRLKSNREEIDQLITEETKKLLEAI